MPQNMKVGHFHYISGFNWEIINTESLKSSIFELKTTTTISITLQRKPSKPHDQPTSQQPSSRQDSRTHCHKPRRILRLGRSGLAHRHPLLHPGSINKIEFKILTQNTMGSNQSGKIIPLHFSPKLISLFEQVSHGFSCLRCEQWRIHLSDGRSISRIPD